MNPSQKIISTAPGGNAAEDLGDDEGDSAIESGPGEPCELRELQVPTGLHGRRLDHVLVELVPEFSRSYLQQLVEQGALTLNGQPQTKPAAKLRAGERAVLALRPTPQSQAFKPEPMALDVVHRDEHLLVIHKPAGLVVHPAPGNWRGTLLNGLLALDERAALLPRAGIVHRLDKDTSGLMLVARSRTAMDALVRMIAAREVSRQYQALAHQPWSGPSEREVDGAIGRDPRNRLRMAVVDLARHPGKPARTTITLLGNAQEGAPGGCWVRCALHTGRTHQIRVHMASLGHPLLADALYGGAPAAGMARQALHAWRLAFKHPVSGQPLVFEAPLPADMAAALAQWGLRYNPREGS